MLLVSPGYPPLLGGVEDHVAQLAGGLARRGWQVEVATQAVGGEGLRHEQLDGVSVRRFPLTVRHPAYRWSTGLHQWLAREASGHELVHAHGYHGLPALSAARAQPAKLVFTPHYHGGGHTLLASALHIPYRRFGARIFILADAIVCVSPSEAELVARRFPEATKRIHVIPNGVKPADAALAPFPGPRTVILYSGRLEPYKRLDVLIEAMIELSAEHVVVVTGTGPDQARLAALSARHGVADRIHFTGFVASGELARWQRTSTLYVSLSTHEAYNIGAHEAAAAGARVVASDIPAHRDLRHAADPGAVTLVPQDISPSALAHVLEATGALGRVPAPRIAPGWDDVVASTIEVYDRGLTVDAAVS